MPGSSFRRRFLSACTAPFALALVACGSGGESETAVNGKATEDVAPPAGSSWAETIERTAEGGYRMGNPEAPIRLVEFGSLTCPHCAHFAEESGEELRGMVESGRVSFEFRNFVMNPLDLTMAMAVRCGSPESFFALTEQTFANQEQFVEAWTQAGEAQAMQAVNQPPETRYQSIARLAGLTDFFASRGIAADQANACLARGEAGEQLVAQTNTQSQEHDVTGTPAFLINGRKVEGSTWADIRPQLQGLGAQ